MNNEELRRWAIERMIAYTGEDTDKLFALADKVAAYVRGDGAPVITHAEQTKRIRWTDALNEALAEMTAAGTGPKAIGIALFRRFGTWPTVASVKTQQKKLGLTKVVPPSRVESLAKMQAARARQLAEAAD